MQVSIPIETAHIVASASLMEMLEIENEIQKMRDVLKDFLRLNPPMKDESGPQYIMRMRRVYVENAEEKVKRPLIFYKNAYDISKNPKLGNAQ